MTARRERDTWTNVQPALDVLNRHLRGGKDPLGLHDYQEAIVRHSLRHLASRPGLIIAERTGRGKSQIAMAILAALARATADEAGEPVRVGLLAPNAGVLTNWVGDGGLFNSAFSNKRHDSYLWRDGSVSWQAQCTRTGERVGSGKTPSLEIFADHYSFGITHGFGSWSKHVARTREQAEAFVGGGTVRQLDLLIIDEAHQLKSARTGRAKALETLFGLGGSPIAARRVLLLTATPFQLRAAPEMARLLRILRWPVAKGEPDFAPEIMPDASEAALQRLFERFERALAHWLRLRAANLEAEAAHAEALQAKAAVERVLRQFIIRTDAPADHVHTFYGRPDPADASRLPDPMLGLAIDEALERLLFLSWDGSIASRTTFVASEQQTLTSSAAALQRRHKKEVALSAVEQGRRPLAPPRVQQALVDLASSLAAELKDDHAKVRSTVDAVSARARSGRNRPTLVFAERTETLQTLKLRIERTATCRVAVVDGDTPKDARDAIIEQFRTANHRKRVDVVLASKVAEMGLDIDGPEDRDDIWLIHHDFPWNPAMVDQRNGRVWRPAKRGSARPVKITYPFIRDTVDERIFKRMLLRQAIAELLLGTGEVARALRLTDQSSLDGLALERIRGAELRALTPDLAPIAPEVPPPAQDERREPVAPEAKDLRPAWCPIELVALAEARMCGGATNAERLRRRVEGLAASLCLPRWGRGQVDFLCVDLIGRKQTVAVGAVGDVVEVLSVADDRVDSERVIQALSKNAEPGAAGVMLLTDSEGSERIVARAANLLDTLGDGELQRLVVECARRADEWESAHYGAEDRW